MTLGSQSGYWIKISWKTRKTDWGILLSGRWAPLGGSVLPQIDRNCYYEQCNEWTEKRSKTDMTLWWTVNLLGAQRGSADWLNANPPPAREEDNDNDASVCEWGAVSLCPTECNSLCLLQPTLGILVVLNYANAWLAPEHPKFLIFTVLSHYKYPPL